MGWRGGIAAIAATAVTPPARLRLLQQAIWRTPGPQSNLPRLLLRLLAFQYPNLQPPQSASATAPIPSTPPIRPRNRPNPPPQPPQSAARLLYRDYKVGTGEPPQEGQQVVFDYTGYNESGAAIDSSYRQGRPSETRLGIQGLIPGGLWGGRERQSGGRPRRVSDAASQARTKCSVRRMGKPALTRLPPAARAACPNPLPRLRRGHPHYAGGGEAPHCCAAQAWPAHRAVDLLQRQAVRGATAQAGALRTAAADRACAPRLQTQKPPCHGARSRCLISSCAP